MQRQSASHKTSDRCYGRAKRWEDYTASGRQSCVVWARNYMLKLFAHLKAMSSTLRPTARTGRAQRHDSQYHSSIALTSRLAIISYPHSPLSRPPAHTIAHLKSSHPQMPKRGPGCLHTTLLALPRRNLERYHRLIVRKRTIDSEEALPVELDDIIHLELRDITVRQRLRRDLRIRSQKVL
jgi:hypothetical protein